MNELIVLIYDCGFSELVRLLFIASGTVMATIFCVWYGKKIGVKPFRSGLAVVCASVLILGLMKIMQNVITWMARLHIFGINTVLFSMARTFVFVPIVGVLVSKLLRIGYKKVCDLFAFSQLINCAFSSLGCTFPGCCIGFACEWGLYSPSTGEKVFPIQIVNAGIMLLIGIFLFLRAKKRGYESEGKQYPIMLVFFGSTRFVTEFFMDNEKLFYGLSAISIHAIFMCFVGVIALFILNLKSGEKLRSDLEVNHEP